MNYVNRYVQNASYGKSSIAFTVFGRWLLLNGTSTSFAYGINSNGCPGFVLQVIRAAEVDYNLSSFSDLLIVHAGFPNDFYQMRPEENAASNCLGPSSPLRGGIAWVSEDYYVAGWIHEMLHAIGGYFQGAGVSVLRAPDLYDEEAVQAGANDAIYVGNWDIMSSGSGGMTAWSRMKMGWLSVANVYNMPRWDNTIINITSLDIASRSTQAIKVPISTKTLVLSNGTVADGSTYYLVEYRTPTGVDSSLSRPTVLVTRANDTRYLEHLSGPLLQESALVYGSSPVSYPDDSLNLTISVLDETKTTATLLFTTPKQYGSIEEIQSEVYAAVSDAVKASKIAPLVDLPPYGWSYESKQALAYLKSGDFALANTTAIESIEGVSQHLTNTMSFFVYFTLIFDATLLGTLLLLAIGRRPKDGYIRYFDFSRVNMSRALLLLVVIVAITSFLQTASLVNITSAVASYDNSALEWGTLDWVIGLALWVVMTFSAIRMLRGARYDYRDDAEEYPPDMITG